ncbi:MAG TPA: hypothetical protein VHL79_14010 [Ramlibacter sp.]|jgi:hypothetical protein|nr:hypothetical protein [Ramlibacter sp.]
MKNLFATTAFALAAFAPVAALAQFSMPSVPGLGKSSGAANADVVGQGDALVRNYVAANKEVLNANGKMLAALGLKEKAATADSTANAMSGGATEGSLSDSNKVVADTGGAIASELAKKPVLDAGAKAVFAAGLVHLVNGGVKYAGLGKDVKDMGSSLKGASPLQMAKLSSAAWVVSKFPGSASDLYNTLKVAIDFAREQNIPIPSNSNDAMAAIGAANS